MTPWRAVSYNSCKLSSKVFRPPGRVPFCTNRKEPKNRQGDASEQTTALPPRSAMPLSPWTPKDATRAFSTVIAPYARRGAAVELTSFLRRCRSSCGHCKELRCSSDAPGDCLTLKIFASPGALSNQRTPPQQRNHQRQRRKKNTNSTLLPRRACGAIILHNAPVASHGGLGARNSRPRRQRRSLL